MTSDTPTAEGPSRTVVLRLNQQQLELIDRTIANGEANDRAALVRRALRELAAKRGLDAPASPARAAGEAGR